MPNLLFELSCIERNNGTAIIKCGKCDYENKVSWGKEVFIEGFTEGFNEKDVQDIFCYKCNAQLTKVTHLKDDLTS